MIFSLDVLPARKGDCLILHFGPKNKPRLIMIDGGPSNVYKPHLKPRLEKIRAARNLPPAEPLPVEALMISHVDDDHIKGILDLTRELRMLKQGGEPLPLRIGSLWHNSFDDLLNTTPAELKAEAAFGTAALAGDMDVSDVDELDTAMVLASIPQGRDLRIDAEFFRWRINREFDGKLILASDKPKAIEGGLKMTVVGPMKPELQALQKAHDRWLAKQKETPTAALAAFIDKSIPNLSSLVFLAEADGKKMLLTGDARGDKILEGLQLVKLLPAGNASTMHVDLLKVPHHGSANNLETKFFARVTADHYVFSGNGEHGNPERESLKMLFDARGNAAFTMHFTYPIADIDTERKKDWEKEQKRENDRKAKTGKGTPREDWSDAKHGLQTLFADRQGPGQKIRIVGEGQGANPRHVIDLLDTTVF
jgi:hypothetical protein